MADLILEPGDIEVLNILCEDCSRPLVESDVIFISSRGVENRGRYRGCPYCDGGE